MNDRDCRQALDTLIAAQSDVAQQLAVALAIEADALRQLDPEALDQATLTKQRCVEALDALDGERHALWLACGENGEPLEPLLDRIDRDGGLSARWQALLALLDSCREANQRNGAVVTLQRRRVAETLGLLHGANGRGATYDASGEVDEAANPQVRASI